MSKFWILFLIIPVILSGPNDTLDQLRAVITNVPYDEQAQGKYWLQLHFFFPNKIKAFI